MLGRDTADLCAALDVHGWFLLLDFSSRGANPGPDGEHRPGACFPLPRAWDCAFSRATDVSHPTAGTRRTIARVAFESAAHYDATAEELVAARDHPGDGHGTRGRGCARSSHPPRLAESVALRRRARRLHLRQPPRDVRARLPVRDVAAAAADGDGLEARLADFLPAGPRTPEPRAMAEADPRRHPADPVHLAPGSKPSY